MANLGSGGVYTPLKQIITDTESDEDIHHETRDKLIENLNSTNINSGLHSSRSNNYSMSDLDEQNSYLNTMETTMENISFLQIDDAQRMSFLRKMLFVFSIILCAFTVIFFLWWLPCSNSAECAATAWRDKTTSWEIPYDDIELKGNINAVPGALPNSKNLIFLYRGNVMQAKPVYNENINGVLLIVGNSGKIGWFTREARLPTEIDCSLLDVDRDGKTDCIIVGTEGLLAALNPLSGTFHWYIHQHEGAHSGLIGSVDFPLLLMDIDGDGIQDLLASCSISNSLTVRPINHNTLVIISGARGSVIGKPLVMNDCTSIHKLTVDPNFAVTFQCKNETNKSESLEVIQFSEIYKKIMKKEINSKHKKMKAPPQHRKHVAAEPNEERKDTFATKYGKLVLENYGHCPENCRLNMQLKLQRNGTEQVYWNYSANHVRAAVPSSFSFSDSLHGYVVKL